MEPRLPRPHGIPAHERCSLRIPDLTLIGHPDGLALEFGPGPVVGIFRPTIFEAQRQRLMAAAALLMLGETLASQHDRKDA